MKVFKLIFLLNLAFLMFEAALFHIKLVKSWLLLRGAGSFPCRTYLDSNCRSGTISWASLDNYTYKYIFYQIRGGADIEKVCSSGSALSCGSGVRAWIHTNSPFATMGKS
jgi:hypothetical protein